LKVSVVMTVYGQEVFLKEALNSILNQTFSDFEFIIVIEYGADAQTMAVVEEYLKYDNRIKLIYNSTHLGLAQSLNEGIKAACGEYIARMDDDDISFPSRFEKQVQLLDANPNIGVCGAFQKTIRPDSESELLYAFEPEELKAEMLFGCQLTHTSVMFRRRLFLENGWLYDSNVLAEDFKLWSSILAETQMANISEVLVGHRYGFGNISIDKGKRLYLENIETIKNNISQYLNLDVSKWQDEFFCPWRNFPKNISVENAKKLFANLSVYLKTIEQANQKTKFVASKMMTKVLIKRYCWMLNNIKKVIPMNEFAAYISNSIAGDEDLFSTFLSECLSEFEIDYSKLYDKTDIKIFPSTPEIIIFGLGQAFVAFTEKYSFDYVRSKYQIVGISDSVYKSGICDIPFISLNEMNSMDFDYIFITSGKYYLQIKEMLIKSYNISASQIGLLEQIVLVNFKEKK